MRNAQHADPMVRFPRNQMRSSAADERSFGVGKVLVICSSIVLLQMRAAAPSWRSTVSIVIVLELFPLRVQPAAESNDSIWIVGGGSVVLVVLGIDVVD